VTQRLGIDEPANMFAFQQAALSQEESTLSQQPLETANACSRSWSMVLVRVYLCLGQLNIAGLVNLTD